MRHGGPEDEKQLPSPHPYDPLTFWNGKATRAGGDPMRAVCHDDPAQNRCIDRVQRSVVNAAFDRIPGFHEGRGLRVLDYGCGSGRWAPFFLQHGCVYRGVDIAPAMVKLAKEHHPDTHFTVLGEKGIPFPPAEFDLVVSIATIHHNPREEQDRILDELIRVLKPSGHLLLFESVGDPDPSNPIEYARPRLDWDRSMGERGLAPLWYRGVRYFILCSAVRRMGCLFRRTASPPPKACPGWILAADALLDPILGPLLPERYHQRAGMLFRKSGPTADSDGGT